MLCNLLIIYSVDDIFLQSPFICLVVWRQREFVSVQCNAFAFRRTCSGVFQQQKSILDDRRTSTRETLEWMLRVAGQTITYNIHWAHNIEVEKFIVLRSRQTLVCQQASITWYWSTFLIYVAAILKMDVTLVPLWYESYSKSMRHPNVQYAIINYPTNLPSMKIRSILDSSFLSIQSQFLVSISSFGSLLVTLYNL